MWKADQFTANAHVLSIPSDIEAGNDYRLEVGLYYTPTMERLAIVDALGRAVADQMVIGTFNVVE